MREAYHLHPGNPRTGHPAAHVQPPTLRVTQERKSKVHRVHKEKQPRVGPGQRASKLVFVWWLLGSQILLSLGETCNDAGQVSGLVQLDVGVGQRRWRLSQSGSSSERSSRCFFISPGPTAAGTSSPSWHRPPPH